MSSDKQPLSLSTLLILALTAVVPLAVATGFSNFERARQLVLVGFAALALLSWGVGLIRHGRAEMASPGTMALGGAFGLFVVGSLAWSGLPLFGAISVLTWVGLGVVFLVLAVPVGRAPEFLDWTTAVATGAIGAGGLGLYEFFGGGGLTPVWDPAGMTGGFDSMAFATAFYLLAVPLLIASVGLARGLRRWFMALALLMAILHLGLVVDIAALGALGLVMAAVGAVIHVAAGADAEAGVPIRLTAIAAVLTVAVVCSGLFLFDRPEEQNGAVDLPRISQTGDFRFEDPSGVGSNWWYFASDRTESPVDQRFRPYLNSVARGLWEKEPILGHGAGGWWLMQTDVIDDSDPVVNSMFNRYPAFKSPHSDYARLSVEQGALGLLLFLLFAAGILTAIVGGARRGGLDDEEDRIRTWALATTVITGLVLMAFLPVLELVSSGVLWFGAAAIAVACAGQSGGDSRWLAGHSFGKKSALLRYGTALVATALAVGMVIPAAQHGQSALDRGYADHLMLGSEFRDAISLYEKAHQRYPAHPEVLYNIALAHYMTGSTMEGVGVLDEAIELRPHDARFRTHAAMMAIREHRTESALEHGREAVRTGPNYMQAYDSYAAALQRRGRFTDSAALFKAALDRNPPVEIRGTMRVHYAHILGEQIDRPAEAMEQYELAMKELPHGTERTLLADRIEELERRLERERLEAEGKPIPPELHPDFDGPDAHHHHDHGFDQYLDLGDDDDSDHDHDHDHDHHHH